MSRKLSALALAASLLAGSVLASPITYSINRSVGAGSVTGTITTDGTFGSLAIANITAWSLLFSSAGLPGGNLTSVTGDFINVLGSGLSATSLALDYDFGVADDGGFALGTLTAGGGVWCMAAGPSTPCASSSETLPIEGLWAFDSIGAPINAEQTHPDGVQTLGTALLAVPEPGSVALVLAALMGAGLARRRFSSRR